MDHKSHMDMKRDLAINLIISSKCLNPFHLDICDFCYLFIFSFISSNIGLLCLNKRTNEGIVFTSLIIVSLFQLQYGYWYLFVLLLDIKGKRIWTWVYILAIIQSHVTYYNEKLLLVDSNHFELSLQNVYKVGHKRIW